MANGSSGLVTVVTGAGGFVGRVLAARMRQLDYPGTVRLVDRLAPPGGGHFESVAAELTDRTAMAAIVADADRVVHLAALPGGAAEADPAASRAINLDATLDLLAALPRGARLVCAGSIAVFGDPLPAEVDDATPPRPTSVYGTHKRMIELAVADARRRGAADALVLRLPGIVARPRGAGGFASAFMSDVVSAFAAGSAIALPVGPDATMWLMSARRCADNLLHALAIAPGDVAALTLPAVRLTMADLVAALAAATGHPAALAHYRPDPRIEAAFGRLPPLATPAADGQGFAPDGGVAALVAHALADLAAA